MLRRVVIAGLLSSILILLLLWFWLQQTLSRPLLVPVNGYELTLEQGTGINSLAATLAEHGVLESALELKVYARLFSPGEIQAGDYLLLDGETIPDLLAKLISGSVRQYAISFPEGWTFEQWRARLASVENIDQTLAGLSKAEIAEILSIVQANPEGWFAPDTYIYRSGDSDLSILERSHQSMLTLLDRLWASREEGLPYETPYEALVMASIVERETGVANERAQIAGVFVRRLHSRMRLQTDPTVIYGLGKEFKGNLTRKHLQQKSAYNTYLNRGLPPTPIANPGAAALEATLHPASGTALFFVARGDGSHQFSNTLDEHNKAVRRYQIKKRSKNYRSAPKKAAPGK